MVRTKTEDPRQKARNAVLRLIKFRLQSEKEVRDKLKRKDFSTAVIDETIQYFKNIDIIDDRQFAKLWTSSRLKRPFGINRIRFELNEKGIEKSIIQATLSEATVGYQEFDIAFELAQSRRTKYENIEPAKIQQRILGYLRRRGFNSDIIYKVIKKL